MNSLPILVVEDEPDGQELVSRMLKIMRLPVEVTGNGEQAWQMLKSKSYQAAVIDLALPGMDGTQLVKMIRADPNLSGLPCVAITAYHTPELKQQALIGGFDSYFPKPIDSTLFLEALQSLAPEV